MISSLPIQCSVLLIDDEAIAEDFIAHGMANSEGISLRYDNRSERAVELSREINATTVVVDLRMPGADGFDVIRMLRAQPDTEQVPIILLSSEDDADIKARAFALGANDYLVKWPDRRELEARIRYHTGAYLARRERDAAFLSLRQREEELRVSQAALHQAQKMEAIGHLTGGVAHDFNNVLQIIASNLQLLKRTGAVDQSGTPRIDAALRGVERGARLASHLLAFARRQPLQNAVVDLTATLTEMDDMLRRLLAPRASVVTTIAADLWRTTVDVGQLTNVLLNLAINARDAMPEGGTLVIGARNVAAGSAPAGERSVDYVGIEIRDNGTGMSQAVLRRAFEPFFTTKPTGQGTGLGLSMVYGFIKQSGGEITLESEEGVGTCIRIYLRRTHDTECGPASPMPAAPKTLAPASGTETILVVDDEDLVREAAVESLSVLGYTVLSASNADDAAELLRSGMTIDLVFCDVIMPGRLDALTLSELVHEKLPQARMLFTSGYAEGVLSHDGKVLAGISLLHKPYTIDMLAARIRRMLDGDGDGKSGSN